MAAFSFPQNPSNGDPVRNNTTGVNYVYVDPPGKWEVVSENYDSEYVNVIGDTMTGPLTIQPTESQLQGALKVIPSSEVSNNRVMRLYSTSTKYFFEASANTKITYTGTDFRFFPSLNYFTPPGTAGFRIAGPVPGDSSPLNDVLNCYYNSDDSGTQIKYFGQIFSDEDLVNKGYVDNLVTNSEESLIHGGTIAEGNEGSVSSTGNLSIQKSSTDKGGNLYIRSGPDVNGDGATNVIALTQSGQLSITPPGAVGGGALNISSAYVSDGSSNYLLKLRRTLNSAGDSEVFTQVNAKDRLLQYKGPVQISPIQLDANGHPAESGDGVLTLTAGSAFIKKRGGDGVSDFTIQKYFKQHFIV